MKWRSVVSFAIAFILLGSVVLLQSACTKTVTKTVTDTLKKAWQPLTLFNLGAGPFLAGASIGDSVLVVATNTEFTTVAANTNRFNYTFSTFLIGTTWNTPAFISPYLSKDLCAYATATSLNVMSIPVYSQYSSFSYTPVYTPGMYSAFQQSCNYPSQCYPTSSYPVIRNKYLLTPVEAIYTIPQKTRFDLLSFDSSQILSRWGMGGSPTVKSIFLQPAPGTIGFSLSSYFCASFYNKFFVYYGGQFFRIDTLGNIKQFGYSPAPYSNNFGVFNMFTMGNTLFINSGGVFFSSTDQGESWTIFNDFSNANIGWLIFRNVGNKLYATIGDVETQLFKVAISGKNLNLSEINNDGLQNSVITSITQCGRYDFITTATGVFYRDTAYVDQLKTPIR